LEVMIQAYRGCFPAPEEAGSGTGRRKKKLDKTASFLIYIYS